MQGQLIYFCLFADQSLSKQELLEANWRQKLKRKPLEVYLWTLALIQVNDPKLQSWLSEWTAGILCTCTASWQAEYVVFLRWLVVTIGIKFRYSPPISTISTDYLHVRWTWISDWQVLSLGRSDLFTPWRLSKSSSLSSQCYERNLVCLRSELLSECRSTVVSTSELGSSNEIFCCSYLGIWWAHFCGAGWHRLCWYKFAQAEKKVSFKRRIQSIPPPGAFLAFHSVPIALIVARYSSSFECMFSSSP